MAAPSFTKLAAWLAPSVVAAFAGALITGLVEVRFDVARFPIATAAIAPVAIPVLLVASVVARGLYAAWLPETLLATLREDRGGMPRLAAWVGVVWLGLLGLAWAVFQGIWLLASWTAFKPNSISFLAPVLAVLALVVIVAASRPAAELFTIIARWIDRRWQRIGPGSLLRAPVILIGAAIASCVAGYLVWILLVSRRMPNLSGAFLVGAVAGVLATCAVHAAWRGPRIARIVGGGVVIVAPLVVIVLGLRAIPSDAATTIEIWSESRLGKLGLERIADIESIRDELPVSKPASRGDGKHRDIVLITLDGVRTDRALVVMPTLADLARKGMSFDFAFAPSTAERRAIPAFVTGISAHRIRGDASETDFALDPRHVSFAERLRAAGYQTAAFTCCFEQHRTWLRGFEHRGFDADPASRARDWITTRTGTQPLLIWIHLAVPWPADRESIPPERRLAVYDAGLATIDRAIAEALKPLASPIIAIAGIRGEELGEHGQAFSSDDLYNTQVRVPLVFVGPTIHTGRITEAVSIIDVAPTLVELASFVPPRGMASDGISLVPVLFGMRGSTSNFAFAAVMPDSGPPRSSMVVRGTNKLIDNGGTLELYDLKTDPDERINLVTARATLLGELRSLLASRLRSGSLSPF